MTDTSSESFAKYKRNNSLKNLFTVAVSASLSAVSGYAIFKDAVIFQDVISSYLPVAGASSFVFSDV